MIEEFLRVAIVLGIILALGWGINVGAKKLKYDNQQWRVAAQQYGLQYENMRQGVYLNNQSSLDLREFSYFLPVVRDSAHVLGVEHKISGSLDGHPVIIVDARAGFSWRFSMKPAQTSPFFFFGSFQLSSNQQTILLSSRKMPWGEVRLHAPSNTLKIEETDSFTIFAQQDDRIAKAILAVAEKHKDQPAFDLAIMNDRAYLFSPFRPDPKAWLKLASEIIQIAS